MPHRPPNNDALAMNAAWKAQQAKKQAAAQQKPIAEPRQALPAAKPEPVVQKDTSKPTGETPEECRNCTVSKKCKNIMRLWYKHTPRPQLVRAWCSLIDQHAREMVCLSALREG